jgi:hypothetical protein
VGSASGPPACMVTENTASKEGQVGFLCVGGWQGFVVVGLAQSKQVYAWH